jgi:hypothetical protein
MMFKKISIIASLLFFLLGTNVLAKSNIETKPNKTITSVHIKEEAPMTAYILPGTVSILFLIGIGSYWLIYRRKTLKKEA